MKVTAGSIVQISLHVKTKIKTIGAVRNIQIQSSIVLNCKHSHIQNYLYQCIDIRQSKYIIYNGFSMKKVYIYMCILTLDFIFVYWPAISGCQYETV